MTDLGKYYYKPGYCSPISSPAAPVVQVVTQCKRFRLYTPLVAGRNVIVHSLGLEAPFATIVQLRDPVIGSEIQVKVVGETANSVTIIVPTAQPTAQITVI